MDWLAHIPPGFWERAYRVGNEFAWSREDAIQVAEALNEKRFVVLGAEIWLPTNPGPTIPTPFTYTWTLGADYDSSLHTGVVEFIRNFEWAASDVDHHDLEPYFNLTVMPLDA
jgi:hypothetical protein